jgi:hypothetical protein
MSNHILSTTPIGTLALNTTNNTIGINSGNLIHHITNNSNGSAVSFVTKEELEKRLSTIEKRLAILVPNPVHLEKYESLKKAYEHYKMLEILLVENYG